MLTATRRKGTAIETVGCPHHVLAAVRQSEGEHPPWIGVGESMVRAFITRDMRFPSEIGLPLRPSMELVALRLLTAGQIGCEAASRILTTTLSSSHDGRIVERLASLTAQEIPEQFELTISLSGYAEWSEPYPLRCVAGVDVESGLCLLRVGDDLQAAQAKHGEAIRQWFDARLPGVRVVRSFETDSHSLEVN